MKSSDNYKVLFIIAQKYVKGFPCFIEYYVQNIRTFYPDNSFILIVDNNSTYLNEIQEKMAGIPKLLIITNTSESKFELGAYKFGVKYILENHLHLSYSYFVFSQDSYVIKNKFPFETLENVLATSIVRFRDPFGLFKNTMVQNVLKKIGMDMIDHTLCWANTFILHSSVLSDFLSIIDDIVIVNKENACDCERFLGAILYKLNGCSDHSIDGNGITEVRHYDCWTVDLINTPTTFYFMKKVTNKNENVQDII
jgi:hypothetical protein